MIKREPLVLLSAGMMTAIGDDFASTGAAMRVRFNNHQEVNYLGYDGEPVVASLAAIDAALVGESRWVDMAVRAIREAIPNFAASTHANIPWLLCTPEQSRPGRPDNDNDLMQRIAHELGINTPHILSTTIPQGRAAGLVALQQAQSIFQEGKVNRVLVVGVDSLVDQEALAEFDDEGLLLSNENSNGFIPGEGAVALLIGRTEKGALAAFNVTAPMLVVVESVALVTPDVVEPANADGQRRKPPIDGKKLAAAITSACDGADCRPENIAVRLADMNGVEAGFKEAALSEAQVFVAKDAELPELWLPAESLGEIGAAYAPAAIAWAWHAALKGYLPGNRVLVHTVNLEGLRAAAVLNCLEI